MIKNTTTIYYFPLQIRSHVACLVPHSSKLKENFKIRTIVCFCSIIIVGLRPGENISASMLA